LPGFLFQKVWTRHPPPSVTVMPPKRAVKIFVTRVSFELRNRGTSVSAPEEFPQVALFGRTTSCKVAGQVSVLVLSVEQKARERKPSLRVRPPLRFPRSVSLEEFADDLPAVGKLHRTANRGLVLVSEIEADAFVDRGHEVFHLVGVFGYFRGLGVCCT